MEHGEAGDYLAQNSQDGEQWPIDAKTFEKTYEVVQLSPLAAEVEEKKQAWKD